MIPPVAKKILIIEDYPATAKMVADILEMEGFVTITATSGTTGLEKALAENPELIFLDVMLPEMDGLEVCRRLRANAQTQKTPIVMISVKSANGDIRRGLERGANEYVTKPFDPFKLVEVAKKYLATD
jgi:DNA-binding response OmpR family regulator